MTRGSLSLAHRLTLVVPHPFPGIRSESGVVNVHRRSKRALVMPRVRGVVVRPVVSQISAEHQESRIISEWTGTSPFPTRWRVHRASATGREATEKQLCAVDDQLDCRRGFVDASSFIPSSPSSSLPLSASRLAAQQFTSRHFTSSFTPSPGHAKTSPIAVLALVFAIIGGVVAVARITFAIRVTLTRSTPTTAAVDPCVASAPTAASTLSEPLLRVN